MPFKSHPFPTSPDISCNPEATANFQSWLSIHNHRAPPSGSILGQFCFSPMPQLSGFQAFREIKKKKKKKETVHPLVVSNALWPHGLHSPPGSSVHGILARILEWVATPFSKGIFLTQGLNLGFLNCSWSLYFLSHQGRPLKAIKAALITKLFSYNPKSQPWLLSFLLSPHLLIPKSLELSPSFSLRGSVVMCDSVRPSWGRVLLLHLLF